MIWLHTRVACIKWVRARRVSSPFQGMYVDHAYTQVRKEATHVHT